MQKDIAVRYAWYTKEHGGESLVAETHRLDGRVALVTGAASGNGRAIARRFLREGASVVLVDLNEQGLKESTVGSEGKYTSVAANVGTPEDAHRAVQATVSAYGRLDILVNNAGIVRFSGYPKIPVEEWDEVMRVNATGPFLFAQAAAEAMGQVDAGGDATRSIINITSIEAHIVVSSRGRTQMHYNASKGALSMLTRALAVELASSRIRVNAIAPGIIETPLSSETLQSETARQWFLDRIPLKRIGRPEDVAAGAVFLASDDASYVTGTTLFIDGGWMAQ